MDRYPWETRPPTVARKITPDEFFELYKMVDDDRVRSVKEIVASFKCASGHTICLDRFKQLRRRYHSWLARDGKMEIEIDMEEVEKTL